MKATDSRAAALMLIAMIASAFHLNAEAAFGDASIGASLATRQTLRDFDSVLNPGNILALDSGLCGELAYSLDLGWKQDWLSFRFQDFGLVEAEIDPSLSNRVGECSLGLRAGAFYLDIGKVKISQSRSYFMMPMDFAIDDRTGEFREDRYDLRFAEGRWMASLELYAKLGFFGAAYIPRIEFEGGAADYFSSPQDSRFLFRFSRNIGGVDAGLALSYADAIEAGAQVSFGLGDYAEIHAEGVYRGSESGGGGAAELAIGAALNFPAWSAIIEYSYDGAGLDAKAWDERIEACKAAATLGTPDALGWALLSLREEGRPLACRHYAMIRLSNPSTRSLSASAIAIVNLVDLSGRVMPCLSYEGWEQLRAKLSFAFPFGGEYGELRLLGESWAISIEFELWI